jgi:hypothetical protein
MQLKAEDFNLLAENYYRNQLRRSHLDEAFHLLLEDLRALELIEANYDDELKEALQSILRGSSATEFAREIKSKIIEERASEDEIQKLINLILLSIRHDIKDSERTLNAQFQETSITATSIR